jgi:hypothetical protein
MGVDYHIYGCKSMKLRGMQSVLSQLEGRAMPAEISLSGGNVTPVSRVGATVRRQQGPWTPAVHDLLRHLEAHDFEGTPRVLGFDAQKREILTYIEGTAGFFAPADVRPPHLWSDPLLVEAAAFLRRFHDATVGFTPSPAAEWQLPYPDASQHEVICHNDFAPYNCIFADGHLKAVIDFDTAGPGPRVWDVAYAVYRWVPLVPNDARPAMGLPDDLDVGGRLKRFCDAYGLEQRDGFLRVVQERIDATCAMLIDGASAGNVGYQRHLDEGGHIEGLLRDKLYIRENEEELERWLEP